MAVNVYMITNKVNGKKYIGITKREVTKRWWAHISRSKISDAKFMRAIQKHGRKSFDVKTLVVCPDWEYACDMEQKLIALYDTFNTGYNATLGGEGLNGCEDVSLANLERAWDARRGKPMSEEHKRKISEAHKANGHKPKLTNEQIEKIADARRGSKHSPEWKARISESIKAWHAARKAAQHVANNA